MGLGILQGSPQMFTQISPRAFLSLVLFVSAVFLGTLASARVPRSETRRDAVGHRKTPTTSPSLAAGNSGPGWAIVTSPNTTEQRLVSAACVSGTDCWAAGYYVNTNGLGQTLIEHWDGSSWRIVASPNQTVSNTPVDSRLESVAFTSTSNCLAVGTSLGLIPTMLVEHWDGTFWSIVPSANPSTANNQLHAVACSSAVDCWAVGTYKTGLQNRYTQTLIEHWEGSSWSAVTSPNTGSTLQNRLNGVTCTSASDCWAVGYARTSATNQPAQTLVQHWDGTVWSTVTSPNLSVTQDHVLTSVACSSATDCWAIGYYDTGAIGSNGRPIYQTLTERWNNAAWLIVSSPNTSALDANFLLDVACVSSTQCWSVGYAYGSTSEQALIEQWNGSAWSIVAAPTSQDTQYNYLYGVTCASASQCWATGYSECQHTLTERWDGSTWTIVPSPSAVGGGSRNVLFDVACSAPSDCWAVGENSVGQSFIQHWNGKIWSQVLVPFGMPAHFNSLGAVTCNATHDCWAVGYYYNSGGFDQALAEHWDGAAWSEIPIPNQSPTENNDLNGITCTSTNDCWAVGSSQGTSLIDHWNGSSWSTAVSPNVGAAVNWLTGVACTSLSDCWAVGWSADSTTSASLPLTLIEHWNGSSWTVVSSP